MVTVTRCVKDEQVNVLAMTEGVEWRGLFHQTILCKKVPEDTFCILVPKLWPASYFMKSMVGKGFQSQLKEKYGYNLSRFRNVYVGEVVKSFPVPNNSIDLWLELCPEVFPLWDPAGGPFDKIKQYRSDIVLFRVYETDTPVDEYIKDIHVRQPALPNPDGVKIEIGAPVVDDDEFRRQQNILERILEKHGC